VYLQPQYYSTTRFPAQGIKVFPKTIRYIRPIRGKQMTPEDRHFDGNGSSWALAPGENIEVRTPRTGTRRGVIETVMKDNSGFWLAAHGVEPRVFVPLEEQGLTIQRSPAAPANFIPQK
jgi:hypothetical protein